MSKDFGVKRTATTALFLSFICCMISPFVILSGSEVILIIFLIFWGLVVIPDSPLFSTLVAQYAPEESRGTALTIVNCIGFAITIISILLIEYLRFVIPVEWVFVFLAIGPGLGLINLIIKPGKLPKIKS
ncbi:MFS transporter [Mangrovivirga cuniculi]|uniref:MFS transporter n=1 Tax=Mangrovivirga cuniculi TaxID=2715131 RepID=UPI001FEAAFF8|nr:MFS transporter [Mangrovivirga cuniculi]